MSWVKRKLPDPPLEPQEPCFELHFTTNGSGDLIVASVGAGDWWDGTRTHEWCEAKIADAGANVVFFVPERYTGRDLELLMRTEDSYDYMDVYELRPDSPSRQFAKP